MGKELEWTNYEDMLKRVEAEKAKKKEDDYYDRVKRGTGLPTEHLEKQLEEIKEKLRKELAEAKEKEADSYDRAPEC